MSSPITEGREEQVEEAKQSLPIDIPRDLRTKCPFACYSPPTWDSEKYGPYFLSSDELKAKAWQDYMFNIPKIPTPLNVPHEPLPLKIHGTDETLSPEALRNLFPTMPSPFKVGYLLGPNIWKIGVESEEGAKEWTAKQCDAAEAEKQSVNNKCWGMIGDRFTPPCEICGSDLYHENVPHVYTPQTAILKHPKTLWDPKNQCMVPAGNLMSDEQFESEIHKAAAKRTGKSVLDEARKPVPRLPPRFGKDRQYTLEEWQAMKAEEHYLGIYTESDLSNDEFDEPPAGITITDIPMRRTGPLTFEAEFDEPCACKENTPDSCEKCEIPIGSPEVKCCSECPEDGICPRAAEKESELDSSTVGIVSLREGIRQLKDDLTYWKRQCDYLTKDRNDLIKKNEELQGENESLYRKSKHIC